MNFLAKDLCLRPLLCVLILLAPTAGWTLEEPSKPAPESPADVLVLSNGDTLHGKLVSEIDGKITFHTDALGDLKIGWDKVKELRTAGPFAVLDKNVKPRHRSNEHQIPNGSIHVLADTVTVEAPNAGVQIPIKNAQYIVDQPTLDKQLNHEPNFFTGWNGAATAGATLVNATQNQYTVSGSLGLVRVVPTVGWLTPRNRTSTDFSGSYGKITQPGYTSGGVFVDPQVTKTAIYHIDGERDQYVSTRFFALAQLAYDHNFAQNLQLQQVYGAGMGWTVFNTPQHEADLKATLQYEKQQFITGAAGSNQNLIGSTFSANYMLKTRLFTYVQTLQFLPSYNNPRAYSASETNTATFPAYKNLGFSLGTMDSYLNDPPAALPPTRRNSFQFTMGITYGIKSKY